MADWMHGAEVAGALRGAGPALANHLWQSTAFAGVAAGLALALKKNQARARYWIWMSASMKLLLPLALLAGAASHWVKPRSANPPAPAGMVVAVEDVSEPFEVQQTEAVSAPAVLATSQVRRSDQPTVEPGTRFFARVAPMLPLALGAVWLAGFVTVLVFWGVRWRRVAAAMREAEPLGDGREVTALRQIELAAGVGRPIELRVSDSAMEPGVFGILRPVLAWPARISERLDDAQLEAVLTHEVCHVRRRDNLTAALHMFVEAVFWFHPMVWWISARLVEERERACDEEVLELCAQPQVYAESILKVCEFCVQSPLPCVSGVTGADLKKRVVEILKGRVALKLTWGKRLLLVATALLVTAVPIVLGQAKAAQRMVAAMVAAAPQPVRVVFGKAVTHTLIAEEQTPATELLAEAQADSSRDGGTVLNGALKAAAGAASGMELGPEFEVATIRPSRPNQRDSGNSVRASGRFEGRNTTLRGLVGFAYADWLHFSGESAAGGPGWAGTDRFDVEAKVDAAQMVNWGKMTDNQRTEMVKPMVRRLLADRFQLKLHTETQVKDVFALVQAKGGAKLTEVAPPPPTNDEGALQQSMKDSMAEKKPKPIAGSFMMSGSEWSGQALPMFGLAVEIEGNAHLGGPLVDLTGLKGYYDFAMKVSYDKDAPALLDQIETQLGLRVEPRKLPLKVFVIDSAEKPSVDGAETPPTPGPGEFAQSSAPQAAASSPFSDPNVSPEEEALAETVVFDVASFRVNLDNMIPATFDIPPNGDGFTMLNRPMRDIIRIAYNVTSGPNFHFANQPPWIDQVKWNIQAKVAPENLATWQKLSQAGKRVALRRFCVDYLKLSFHKDMTPYTYYNLVVDKRGPKMALGHEGDDYTSPRGVRIPAPGVIWTGPGEIAGHGGTMAQLSIVLSGHTPWVVHDETGLTDAYNFAISYAASSVPDPRGGARGLQASSYMGDDGPSLFTAVQQLGLKMVATKGPLEGIAIDHVERPPDN